eukprot:Nitzschia sp. Nitz4//scaffold141_size107518//95781//96470//NITZ4_004298-RA/size107518-processed-gene-0.142-mRNA-1//-1//CDS//3329536354//4522//frame0
MPPSAPSSSTKKRKNAPDSGSATAPPAKAAKTDELGIEGFHTYTLDDIRSKMEALCPRVPEVPEDRFGLGDSLDEAAIREWAATMQAILEEFNLLVCCVATATYKWGTDRSGAADQNLSLLNGELTASQEQIVSSVSPRLSNVLAPVVDLVVEKSTKSKDAEGREVKENQFVRKLVDPNYLQLCFTILARNAPMLRQLVLSNFSKVQKVLQDYLKAQQNDSNHGRGFTY